MFKALIHKPLAAFTKNHSILAMAKSGRTLQSVVEELEKFAPTAIAEKWDNVGLLIEPNKARSIQRILLTNDLTERVMLEAVDKRTDMIISYHPPIFAPLKRITQSNWKERIVSICLAEAIALYSPHTAWDAVVGGVNDWLASAVNPCNIYDIQPIEPNLLLQNGTGAGRIFNTNITLNEAIKNIQLHIGLPVHVGMGAQHNLQTTIKRVAVCAGSGGSLLRNVDADLYLTGEMSHHEVLDANHRNVSVILCNHSNSERGFLTRFQPKLQELLCNDCEIMVAEQDEDPLRTYFSAE